jgi:hypothetical protein
MEARFIPAMVLFLAAGASAMPVVDQRVDHTDCRGCTAALAYTLAEGFSYVGQTATAGFEGALAAIEIFATHSQGFDTPWVLDVIDAPGGQPNGTILASSDPFSIPLNPFYDWTYVPLRGGVRVMSGTQFAFTIHPLGVSGLSPRLFAGGWAGAVHFDDFYPRGTTLAGGSPDTLELDNDLGDLFFRTYVVPIPEPRPGLLFLSGAAVCCLIKARKRVRLRWRSASTRRPG